MKKKTKAWICLLLCLLLVAGVAAGALYWLYTTRDTGPATPDFGESAGAWAKNEAGYYFNEAGEVIPAAVKKGIDVSKYQGEIDWEKAQAAGIDFAILRCGIGSEWNGEGDVAEYTQDDIYWRRNTEECTRLGIPFGAYLYSYAATEEQARSEADHVARLLGLKAPDKPGLEDYTAAPPAMTMPIYYDLEDKAITGVYPDEMAALTAAFFDQLESYGYKGEEGVYASLNWVRGRLQEPGFDRWRNNFWVARFANSLGYTGDYTMWQCTYQEPGAPYGVQSETVDVDFIMEDLSILGVGNATSKAGGALASFTNDTRKNELWMAAAGDTATLQLSEPAVADGGQKIYWESSDPAIAKVNKKGIITAVAEGECTITAILADGRRDISCKLRVGSITVPVYATANLHGDAYAENGLDAVAALKADGLDAILLDAGGSLQGSDVAAMTGGMDICSAFSAAGYDLQVFDASDLAFGTERLLSDASVASGSSIAANLIVNESGEPLFARSTSWNRNRISNGMNGIIQQAGKRIGFFALCSTGNAAAGAKLTAKELLETATQQAAALTAQNVDALVCVAGADTDISAIQGDLAGLGVDGVIAGNLQQTDGSEALPTAAAGAGFAGVAKLALTFAPDGSLTVQGSNISAETLAGSWGEKGTEKKADTRTMLDDLQAEDTNIYNKALFTLEETDKESISFGNYVADCYLQAALADADNIPAEQQSLTTVTLAGVAPDTAPAYGEITRGGLMELLPVGSRVQLVQTTGAMYNELLASGAVTETFEAHQRQKAVEDGPVLLVTDTATLAKMSDQNYTVVRDYGDEFWLVRMAISDDTGAFSSSLILPEAITAARRQTD